MEKECSHGIDDMTEKFQCLVLHKHEKHKRGKYQIFFHFLFPFSFLFSPSFSFVFGGGGGSGGVDKLHADLEKDEGNVKRIWRKLLCD